MAKKTKLSKFKLKYEYDRTDREARKYTKELISSSKLSMLRLKVARITR